MRLSPAFSHGMFLAGVFWSVRHGLPVGIGLGFIGAMLVLLPNLGTAGGIPPVAIVACVAGMIAMTLGTIWQKRTAAAVDLRTNAAVQFIGAALIAFLMFGEHLALVKVIGIALAAVGVALANRQAR